ncbi:hypothetical protein HJC23_005469 [Cyclotella cryptica]|uniref:SCP domain-containing protein n=1 Tax=Cyclotella cryptica TaxID=29204 RepID=A0ABD3PLF3_9STRA
MKFITAVLSLLLASAAATNEQKVSSLNHVQSEALIDVDELDDVDTEEPNRLGRSLQNGPNAAKRMATWKQAHNDMRKKYQEAYGGEFAPLKWNMELKLEAENWAKELVTTCTNKSPGAGENPNDYGVNSAMRSGQRNFQNPVAIMNMWEKKLPLGYPKNSVMTQVLWSKTEYVGCADASSALGAAKSCTAAVCFYAKAGNCGLGRFDGNWTQAVIAGPACSTACPSNIVEC